MKMCYDFFSKYFILKLDIKSFVFTSFHVCGDVLNTQNKVLNLNTSLEEVLLVPAFWLFYIIYFFWIVKAIL